MEKYCEGEGITTLQDTHKLPKILINCNARKSAESLVKIHNLLCTSKITRALLQTYFYEIILGDMCPCALP
jgi:hypothetical protein